MFSLENETFSQEDEKFSIMYKVAIEEDKDQFSHCFFWRCKKKSDLFLLTLQLKRLGLDTMESMLN